MKHYVCFLLGIMMLVAAHIACVNSGQNDYDNLKSQYKQLQRQDNHSRDYLVVGRGK